VNLSDDGASRALSGGYDQLTASTSSSWVRVVPNVASSVTPESPMSKIACSV
jgi:hypothetical protein